MTDESPKRPDPQHGSEVTITVDGTTHTIHRGAILVSKLKEEVHVDASLVLSIFNGTEFVDLIDSERVTIKGGEVFASHVPRGSSS